MILTRLLKTAASTHCHGVVLGLGRQHDCRRIDGSTVGNRSQLFQRQLYIFNYLLDTHMLHNHLVIKLSERKGNAQKIGMLSKRQKDSAEDMITLFLHSLSSY